MTSGCNNFKLCPPNFLIFVPLPEDFCDAFCVAGGAFGRPCLELGGIAASALFEEEVVWGRDGTIG